MRENKSGGFSDLSEKMHIVPYGVLGQSYMWQDMRVQQPAWETLHSLAKGTCKCMSLTSTSCWFLLEFVIIIGSIRHLLASMDVAKATGGLIDVWLPPESGLSGSSWPSWEHLYRSSPSLWLLLWPLDTDRSQISVFVNNKYPKIRIQVDKFWKG